MSDTSESIMDMQRQIMLNKSPQERFQQGLEMIASVRLIAENSLKEHCPEATKAELKVLLLQRYYTPDMSPDDMKHCSEAMLHYWKTQSGHDYAL